MYGKIYNTRINNDTRINCVSVLTTVNLHLGTPYIYSRYLVKTDIFGVRSLEEMDVDWVERKERSRTE